MNTKKLNIDSAPTKRKTLFHEITNCLLRIKYKIYVIEREELGEVSQKAKLIKFDLNELDSLFHRLALAETKVEIYGRNLSDLSDLSMELIDLELTPSKAGKRRNEFVFNLARDIYYSYYEEYKKYPTAEELSVRTSKRLAILQNKLYTLANDHRLLPERTASDYIKQFSKLNGNN